MSPSITDNFTLGNLTNEFSNIYTKGIVNSGNESVGGKLTVSGNAMIMQNIAISGSTTTQNLTVTNTITGKDETLSGNLTAAGNITSGNITATNMVITGTVKTDTLQAKTDGVIDIIGNLVPTTTNQYTLGDPTHEYSNVYTQGLVVSGNQSVSGNLTVSGTISTGCYKQYMAMLRTTVTTTGITIITVPTSPGTIYLMESHVLAMQSGNATGASYTYNRSARSSTGGTLSFVGGTDKVSFEDDSQYDVNFVLSGTDILLQVVKAGPAATIDWKACMTVYSYAP